MDNFFVGIDLGSTNIKAALYQGGLSRVAYCSRTVEYFRQGNKVEFDSEAAIGALLEMLRELGAKAPCGGIKAVTLTGQAESLIFLDKNYKPLRPAISWMDERSTAECEELSKEFSLE